jgi:CHAT domain-containing protein
MVYMALGERRKARDEYFKEALKIFTALKDKHREAWTHMCLGSVYTDLNDDRRALEHYEQALPLYRDSKDKGGEANVLHSLGLSYERLGDKQRALQAFEEGLRIEGYVSSRSALLLSIGDIYLDSGETRKGLEYKTQSLVGSVAESKDGEAILLSSIGTTWRTLGNARLAVFYGKQAVNKYQELRQALQGMDYETQKAFLRRLDTVYNSLVVSLIEVGRFAEAVQVINLYQDQQYFDFNRSPNEPIKRIELSQHETTLAARYEQAAEAVRQAGREIASLTHRVGDDQSSEQQVAQRRILEAEHKTAVDAFVAMLDEAKAEFSKPADEEDEVPPATEAGELQKALHDISETTGQKAVALYTVADAERFHVLLVTDDNIKAFATPANSKDFDEKVLRFYALLRSRRYDPRPLGKQLYDIILKPAEAELKGTGARTLLWALGGNLRYVPMAALSPDGKGYLVERYQNVVFTRSERMTRPVSRSWTGVGFGSSQARKVELLGAEFSFAELKGVTAELRTIFGAGSNAGGILPGATFTDAAFTRDSFYESLKQHRPLVHIASHFLFWPGDSSRSFLLLGDGTPLTLDELKGHGRPFEAVELLTLSACNTAAQRADADGREIDGFAELAQRLGADAVMATLWPVSDNSTPQLMSSFYRLRQHATGMTKPKPYARRSSLCSTVQCALILRPPRVIERRTACPK